MARYLAFATSVVMALVSLAFVLRGGHATWIVAAVVFGGLSALGTLDVLQPRATLRRLYPLTAHFRYGLESFRPEIRQYFIEDDQDEVPFSRQQRALVYQRAKNVSDVVPFGSERPMYGSQYEWINHSLAPRHADSHDFRIPVGEDRAQPYAASVFNISAMSFGSLSANAIRALNLGAQRGGFYHDTGEGAIASYHREYGGDLVRDMVRYREDVRRREGQVLGERPRPGHAHGGVLVAVLPPARPAVPAVTACDMPFSGHALAQFEPGHVGAHLGHLAHELVADHHRHRYRGLSPVVPGVDVEVRPADRRLDDPHDRIGWLEDGRDRDGFPGLLTRSLIYQRLHHRHVGARRRLHEQGRCIRHLGLPRLQDCNRFR